jgi:hypothetical protein
MSFSIKTSWSYILLLLHINYYSPIFQRFIFPSDRVDVVDVSSSVTVLSVSLLQQHLTSNQETPTLMKWNSDSRLDSMTYEQLEVDQSGGVVQGIVLPATSELSVSLADYDCQEGTSKYSIVGSAMCVLRQLATPNLTGTSGKVSEDTFQSAIKSTVKVLLSGITGKDRDSTQISSNAAPATSLDSVTLPFVSVGLGRGEVGSVWWDILR